MDPTATRITTPFDARSTAAEVIDGVDLSGRRAVVTGAASGIGIETARALAGAGAEVTLAVRNLDAGARVAEDITATTGNKRLHVAPLDLADRASVAAFADGWDGPLHILVNNAGVMALPEGRTPEGWDRQFTVNHLGHFALARALHGALAAAGSAAAAASAAAARPVRPAASAGFPGSAGSAGSPGTPGTPASARIVVVSSAAHLRSPVVFDDLHFDYRPYEPMLAYGQSKTANVLFAVGANARWAGDGIVVNALSPGGIRTNLQRHVGDIAAPGVVWKTPEQGAATSVLLAASPLLEGVGGRYFADCAEAEPVSRRPEDLTAMMVGVAPYALDPEGADRLWATSERLLAAD
ncbi:SDR family NAD(P)-dependent oxidoreductase [Streptomyces sp. SID8382]|uniref:SDR family NAD(P)-dependent oxidoreductase n=1 Tax=Streptomyces malaysiensis TaxID=92644 RepID=UPI000C2B8264|nr:MULTISPECIES: SDR family NAD(P)-dependent oxidoreductase [unclassified Streptomyces]AUA13311.1 2,3-dihydro-2,3-dihydroxybenzoate dehydrogenase [Streptomyces sp. M56]MYX57309.1 SDR family NAD(P)-dependent oxidoreductase [Streptomyces sp. SID8382]